MTILRGIKQEMKIAGSVVAVCSLAGFGLISYD